MTCRLRALIDSGPLNDSTIIHLDDDPDVSALRVVRGWDGLSQIGRDELVLIDAGPEQGGWLADAAVRAAWEAYAPAVVVPEHLCLFDGPARLAARYRVTLMTVPDQDQTRLQLDLALAIAAQAGHGEARMLSALEDIVSASTPDVVLTAAAPHVRPGRLRLSPTAPEQLGGQQWTRIPIPHHEEAGLWISCPDGNDASFSRLLLETMAQRLSVLLSSPRGAAEERDVADGSDVIGIIGRESPATAAARRLLAPLLDNQDALQTLATWLNTGSISATAAHLGLHRNTVHARLVRCRAALDLDLDDPETRLNVAVACRLQRTGSRGVSPAAGATTAPVGDGG